MAKLYISTQYMENYGAHDWDGTGECPQAWKMKGGDDYFIENINPNRALDLVCWVSPKIEHRNDYSRSYIVSWEVVADDFTTEYEKIQLEQDGKISYPAKVL